MTARAVMIQGTSSSAGKSLLTAGLCRLFARRGMRVAPFKAQNMSNNAAVCEDGAEIGRSQAVQAWAAGIEPTSDMNPILLKPEADTMSSVIVNGRPWKRLSAGSYYQHHDQLWPVVTSALDRLRREFELVIIEGAGSPAEMNLSDRDLVNMAIAEYADAPVLLVGDIERGGVFAQLLGTLWLLQPRERHRVKALIVNKFRGDPELFVSGVKILEQRGQVPVLGVIPWVHDLFLPAEDAATIPLVRQQGMTDNVITIAVLHLPHLANFDDFDPLASEPDVRLVFVSHPDQLDAADAVVLPGTKATLSDLDWLRDRGLASRIKARAEAGVPVVGICGGYQMLGESIDDPEGVESASGFRTGLGLLPVRTRYAATKQTHRVTARIEASHSPVGPLEGTLNGYEIHCGTTESASPWLTIQRDRETVQDGAISRCGRHWGCYVHGLFQNSDFRHAWLSSLGWSGKTPVRSEPVGESLDRFADQLECSLRIDLLDRIVGREALV